MAAVIFDLDGTLIDSAPDIHAGVNAMLAELAAPPLALPEVKTFIGHGVARLVARVAAARALPQPPDALLALFMRHYHAGAARPYPGVIAALELLVAAGCPLGLCTNKPERPTHEVLAILGLTPVFQTVIHGDSLPQRKPDPAPLLAAAAALGRRPAIFVGDSEVDALTAQAAGLPFLLFTGGYRAAAVADIAHHAAFDHFAELPGLIADFVQ